MTERIDLPDTDRTLYFVDYYAAAAWLDEHRDEHPDASTAEWSGTSRDGIYDAATGLLLAHGRSCRACRHAGYPEWDWTRTAAHDDLLAAVRLAGAVPSAPLIEAAAELAEFAPDMTGAELFFALRDGAPIPAGVPLGIQRPARQAS